MKACLRHSLFAIALTCAFGATQPVRAQQAASGLPDGARLVAEARCYMCHQMSETLLAPPYLAIAARHSARRDVMIDVLARKIVNGGGGNWGLVPMAPNQRVSVAEARVMSEWILSLAAE